MGLELRGGERVERGAGDDGGGVEGRSSTIDAIDVRFKLRSHTIIVLDPTGKDPDYKNRNCIILVLQNSLQI